MRIRVKYGLGGLLLFLLAVPAWAQEGEDPDDVTMEVVENPDADEGEYVEDIALPDEAAPEAHENAAFGIETANEARKRARDEGRDFGKETADKARDLGSEAGDASRNLPDQTQ